MRRNYRDPFPSSSERSSAGRRVILPLLAMATALAIMLGALPAMAQESAQTDAGDTPLAFDVIQVSGLVDEIVADFIEKSISAVEAKGSGGLIMQVNSTDAVVSDERVAELARAISESKVPVYGWVGPSGAKAEGAVAQLVAVTEEMAVAVGAKFGKTGEIVVPEELLPPAFLASAEALRDDTVDEEGIIEIGMAVRDAPTLGFFALELPGFGFIIDDSGEQPLRIPTSAIVFSKLPLFDGWMHTFASPAMAYLLFLIGGALLVFEFYTAGIGIAGVVGAGCFVLGSFGLDVLPARWWAVALLVVAILGYAVDVQTGAARAWSVIATVSLVVGSLWLFDGFPISWITLVAGIGGISLAMISGMPSMVRSRFGTPTIGREWMIGSMGVAAEEIKRDGVVVIDGAPWKARVNRSTPIPVGDSVRVVAIEGLYLEVEPEEGGARDYREMRD